MIDQLCAEMNRQDPDNHKSARQEEEDTASAVPRAEAAYADFRRRREQGEDLDFETFCAERRDLEDALRIVHSLHAKKTVGNAEQTLSVSKGAGGETPGADMV